MIGGAIGYYPIGGVIFVAEAAVATSTDTGGGGPRRRLRPYSDWAAEIEAIQHAREAEKKRRAASLEKALSEAVAQVFGDAQNANEAEAVAVAERFKDEAAPVLHKIAAIKKAPQAPLLDADRFDDLRAELALLEAKANAAQALIDAYRQDLAKEELQRRRQAAELAFLAEEEDMAMILLLH